MNYRHAFHAGNFADVLKHLILVRILLHLRDKMTPFRVIDTHAGAGCYDLASPQAARTGEWRDGIGRVIDATWAADAAALVAPYFATVQSSNTGDALRRYPGSPIIAARLMRPHDRLVACELEPVAASELSRQLKAFPQAKVTTIDGWTALNAFVPAKERRGLVIVDPAFERRDDFAQLTDGIVGAHRKWPTGIYLLWYPIKSPDGPDRLSRALRAAAISKSLRVEMSVRSTDMDGSLGACGIIVINPPWRLESELRTILPALLEHLGRDEERGFRIVTGFGETDHSRA